ncbi:MAG: LysM peptidoglycan-binding domain-containing protein [Acidimicrobiales bacterium]
MSPSGRRLTGAAVWIAGMGAAAGVLQWAGQGPLAAPALTQPDRWADWLQGRDPILAAFSVLRVVAVGGLWYVAIAALVGTLLRMVGAASLVRVADRLTIGPVRRMLAGTVSLGLAASGVVAVAAPALRVPAAAAAQAAPPSTTSTSTSTTVLSPATVTMHRLGPAERVRPPAVAPAIAEAAGHWTVRPGECFWSIAESVLADRWGRPPTDAEIVPYWQRLIAANRHELVQRDNPDVIFPGQVFAVPAP